MSDPRRFNPPSFRRHTNGKHTARAYGQRFHIAADGAGFVLYHFSSFRQPFDCLANYETLDDAKAGAIEIARMAHAEGFPMPRVEIERREALDAYGVQAASELAMMAPTLKLNRALSADGVCFFVEWIAPKLIGADLPANERYRLRQAAILLNRAAGRFAPEGEGNVVKFPGGRA